MLETGERGLLKRLGLGTGFTRSLNILLILTPLLSLVLWRKLSLLLIPVEGISRRSTSLRRAWLRLGLGGSLIPVPRLRTLESASQQCIGDAVLLISLPVPRHLLFVLCSSFCRCLGPFRLEKTPRVQGHATQLTLVEVKYV